MRSILQGQRDSWKEGKDDQEVILEKVVVTRNSSWYIDDDLLLLATPRLYCYCWAAFL